jgi:hypothetical protein
MGRFRRGMRKMRERTGRRRLWIVVAMVVACAGLAGQVSIASAESANPHAATSCRDLVRNYRSFNNAPRNGLGEGSPTSIQQYYSRLAKSYRKLAKSGPRQLRTAFKHLGQYMAQVARIDFSNPSSAQQAGQQMAASAQQLGPDIQEIAAYLASVCHKTSPTT